MIDVIIIGAGITGCAIASELGRYDLSVVVLESGHDVASGATKANSGIIHAGFDAVPGTKKAEYNVRGASMYPALCEKLNVEYKKNGALVIALSEEDRLTVEALFERGIKNKVAGLRVLERDEVLALEPEINPDVICALYAPSSAIVSPYEVAFALADDAATNGVNFIFNASVENVHKETGLFSIETSVGKFTSKTVINCAGASGADIHNQLSNIKYHMIHRRGQYYLLDRADPLPITRTVFQCPSNMGKGVLITPTVHGNILIGPSAEDILDSLDTSTTSEGLDNVIKSAFLTWPELSVRTNITNFSGVRAHLDTGDFIIGEVGDVPGAYETIGVESPGLSAAPAIASDICRMVTKYLDAPLKKDSVDRKVRRKPFREMSDKEREDAVKADPLYGNIICRCEMVTEAEIREAIRRPVRARSVDAVKRRTRAGMGRCQGGFCLPRVAAIIADEMGCPITEVTRNGGESYLLEGTVEEFLKESWDD